MILIYNKMFLKYYSSIVTFAIWFYWSEQSIKMSPEGECSLPEVGILVHQLGRSTDSFCPQGTRRPILRTHGCRAPPPCSATASCPRPRTGKRHRGKLRPIPRRTPTWKSEAFSTATTYTLKKRIKKSKQTKNNQLNFDKSGDTVTCIDVMFDLREFETSAKKLMWKNFYVTFILFLMKWSALLYPKSTSW